jgi:hypothetical protein
MNWGEHPQNPSQQTAWPREQPDFRASFLRFKSDPELAEN